MTQFRNCVRALCRIFVVVLAMCAFAEPPRLPTLGDSTSAILAPHEEDALGKMILQQIRSVVPLENDPLIKYFVEKYCYRVAEHSDLTSVHLRPIVIKSEQFNAFAAPGGVIGINLGLFTMARDIHEFASVIAHELAHLSQRHYARRLEKEKMATFRNLVGYLTSVAIIASGATDAGLATMLGSTALADAASLGYSRAQEREADRVGLNTLTRAGFDPHGAARMFEHMQQSARYRREIPEYISTHPITQNRISDMRSQASKKPRGIFPVTNDYQLMRERVESRFITNAKEAAREAQAQNKPYLQAIALSMSSQHEQAIAIMQTIYDRLPDNIIVIGSYADILVEADRTDQAIELLTSKLVIYPNNQPLTLFLAHALSRNGRNEEAVSHLWDQVKLHPEDQDIWYQLAETAGLAKNLVDVHRARAEFFVLRGNYKSAMTQLRLAREQVGEGNRLSQSLDQRLLDIRAEAERAEES
ncbi:MAG: M48 family metalloprotease [Gammaproteobacteria bacterium]|nr:M48 family metalloprotease [Gammaproteobacteria bacterium]